MTSPICTINGLAAPQDVAANSTVTIALQSTSGVGSWSIQCTSTDENNTAAAINATLVVNQGAKTATFTAPALGSCAIFTSIVGVAGVLGQDQNFQNQPLFTTTFEANVLSAGGQRVLALNESFEFSSSYGWVPKVNTLARSGAAPVGTAGGDLAGTFPNPTVAKISAATGNLTWAAATAAPSINQTQQANGSNPNNLTMAPQAPGAGAASTATGTPGSAIVNLAAPVSTGVEGMLAVQRAGVNSVLLGNGAAASVANSGGIWLGAISSETGSNYAILGSGIVGNLILNAAGGGGQVNFRINGVAADGAYTANGHQFFSETPSFGGGVNVIGVTNAGTAPTSNPSGGGILYSQSGAGKWRGSSGTTTTFGPADLEGFGGHCPCCGTDFAMEWSNDQMGSLTVCMHCLAEELGDRPWIVKKEKV